MDVRKHYAIQLLSRDRNILRIISNLGILFQSIFLMGSIFGLLLLLLFEFSCFVLLIFLNVALFVLSKVKQCALFNSPIF